MRYELVAATLLLTAVSATGLQAQQSIRVKLPSIEVAANPEADRLKAEAQALYEEQGKLRKAAALHVKEAAARSPADPALVDALDRAGRLYTYAGDPVRGHSLMEKAARAALGRGDVLRGAHRLLDAAFIAISAKDYERALALTSEAQLLSLSPLIDTTDRTAIIRRIDPSRASLGANF
jgi:tetratricopeptide (TPR) repeat protein